MQKITIIFSTSISKEALDKLPFGVYVINKDGIVKFFNKQMTKISGVKQAKEIEGQNVFKVPTYREYGLIEYIKKGLKGEPFKIEGIKYVSYIGKKESYRNYWGIPIKNKDGQVEKLLCLTEDATAKYRLERQIKEVLKEREALLREVNYRVKNNMQIVYSLLNLRSLNIRDKNALRLIEESKSQIKSMLLIHEMLYQSKSLVKINLKEYVNELVDNLFNVYWVDRAQITKKICIDNITLSLDKTIPCGLIINELVSNSLKYAFPNNKKGEISVKLTLKDESSYELVVSDNGIGLPKKRNIKIIETLGLELIDVLVKQIYGRLEIISKKGTYVKINFPVNI